MDADPDHNRDDFDDCPRTLQELSELRETLPEPVRRRASRASRSSGIDPHATNAEAAEVIRTRTREVRRLAAALRRENRRSGSRQHENQKQTNK